MARSKPEHPKDNKIIVKMDQAQLEHLQGLERATLVTRSEIIRSLLGRATPEQVRECVVQERGY
jgi:hypothetical protein